MHLFQQKKYAAQPKLHNSVKCWCYTNIDFWTTECIQEIERASPKWYCFE